MKQRRKKLHILWKILIICCLFFVAGASGYAYGMIVDKKEQKQQLAQQNEQQAQDKKKKVKVVHNRMGKKFKLESGLTMQVDSVNRYQQIDGMENAVGLEITFLNATKKDLKLPYKYKLNLLFDKISLSSMGIYQSESLQNAVLEDSPSEIKAGETMKVVYLYKANSEKDLNAYKAQLKIKDDNTQHIISLDLDEEQFGGEGSSTTSSSNGATDLDDGYGQGYQGNNQQNNYNNQDYNQEYQDNNQQNYYNNGVNNQQNQGYQGNNQQQNGYNNGYNNQVNNQPNQAYANNQGYY